MRPPFLGNPPPARRAGLIVSTLLFLVAVGSLPHFAQAMGGIRGTVFDRDFDVPLGGVRVTVVEALLTTTTTAEGNFVFERVPPGSYTLNFSKEGFEREVVTGVVVTSGRLADVRADMASEVVELPELIVTGGDLLGDTEIGLLEIRADSINLQDAVSSELIKKAGASDVAGALKLVVGTSVVDGKYATVRGLSDRYTGTTLNGVRVPSADPRKRAVQLDLFPTGTIENVTVTKSFTPDLQGDFTGGGVDIVTKSIPLERTASFSIGTEFNGIATGNAEYLTYEDGGVPPSGFQDGSRSLPSRAQGSFPSFPRMTARPTEEEIANANWFDRTTRSFSPVIGVSRETGGWGGSFSALAGTSYGLGGSHRLGLIGALTYSRKPDLYLNGQNNTAQISVPGQPIANVAAREDSVGSEEVLIGLLAGVGWSPNDNHEFGLRLVGNQSAVDTARFQVGAVDENNVEQNHALLYAERSVRSYQLQGDDTFPRVFSRSDSAAFSRLRLTWSLSLNTTEQDEPDVRFFRNRFNKELRLFSGIPNSTDTQVRRRIFRNIQEEGLQGALDTSIPFTRFASDDGEIKLGVFQDDADRFFVQRSFTYIFPNQIGSNPAVQENREKASFVQEKPGQLWTDVFLDDDRIGLADNRCVISPAPCTQIPHQLLWTIDRMTNDVDYDGGQVIGAYYLMARIPIASTVDLIGGARNERTQLDVNPFNAILGTVETIITDENLNRAVILIPDEDARVAIDQWDLLPAISLVYRPIPSMNLRASYSETLARPTFRELAPIATSEFIAGDEFLGNPDLLLSAITNYDIRWEWFPHPGALFALSAFSKEITNPIEYISFGASNRTFVQPVNYNSGTVEGIEVEARSDLGGWGRALAGLAVGFNFTYLDSEVKVPEAEQKSLADFGLEEESRQLLGQPEYIGNLNLTYDNSESGTSVGVFFNAIGDVLVSGAARGLDGGVPNVFEERYETLDFSVTQEVWEGAKFTFRAKNLTAPERVSVYRSPDGQEALKSRRDTARTYNFILSYAW